MTDKICTAEEAIRFVKDGDSVAINAWGLTGTPHYLLRALRGSGVKNLTLYCNNLVRGSAAREEMGLTTVASLIPQLKKVVVPFIGGRARSGADVEDIFGGRVEKGEIEIEASTHGVYIQRFLAGAMGSGGFYSPIGINTIIEEDKEKRVIDNTTYVLEKPIRPDVGFVKAHTADKQGNLVYLGTSRASNPIVAMASKLVIAEVFNIVEAGELDPEAVITPGIYVDHIVKIPEDDISSINRVKEVILMTMRTRLETEAAAAVETTNT